QRGAARRRGRLADRTLVPHGAAPVPIQWVLIRDPRRTFATQALLCMDSGGLTAADHLVVRCALAEGSDVPHGACPRMPTHAHVRVKTQRQWSQRALAPTTPALLGLCSLVTLLAHEPMACNTSAVQPAAWYRKTTPTFSDALALVRRQ